MKTYPACPHRYLAERYLWRSCEATDDWPHDSSSTQFCEAYAELFPNGAIRDESLLRRCDVGCEAYVRSLPHGPTLDRIEELMWRKCEAGSCAHYVDLFPNGQHIQLARARVDLHNRADERARRADERAHDLEAARLAALWAGPIISCHLVVPDAANPNSVTATLLGKLLSPTLLSQRLTYQIPASQRTVEVCYENPGGSGYSTRKSCADMTLEPGTNRLPLSRVRIFGPRRYTATCARGGGFSGLPDTIYLMPGEHSVSCSFYGGAHVDHSHASVDHYLTEFLTVTFEAPPFGGEVIVAYETNGNTIEGRAMLLSSYNR
jgi:hypothetical protein